MNRDMEKYDAFEQRMKERFPNMFSQPHGGFAVGPGWWPIIESLCGNIQHYLNYKNKESEVVAQVVVTQIKEKFGGLRFYYSGGDDEISGMVRMAEAFADSLCEDCGGIGKRRGGGWIRTLCDVHEAEHNARIEEQAKKDGLEL